MQHYKFITSSQSINKSVTTKRTGIRIIHQLILAIDLFQQVALHQKKKNSSGGLLEHMNSKLLVQIFKGFEQAVNTSDFSGLWI